MLTLLYFIQNEGGWIYFTVFLVLYILFTLFLRFDAITQSDVFLRCTSGLVALLGTFALLPRVFERLNGILQAFDPVAEFNFPLIPEGMIWTSIITSILFAITIELVRWRYF